MLTPAKIKNHHFEAAGRNAYKINSVDSFFEEVAESYEQMFQENGEMFKKLNLLAERLEEYKKDEDNIRNALLTAQRMAEKITADAQAKADALVAEVAERTATENARLDAQADTYLASARVQADAMIADAQAQAEMILSNATSESKEAAISARSDMIKEEAALEMMKAEVTKFKKSIIEQYTAQFELIEKLPEYVYEKFEEAKAAPVEEPAAEIPAEPVEEEAPAEEAEEETVEEAVETVSHDIEFEEEEPAEEEISVDTLQQMIDDGEDTDASADVEEEEPELEVLEAKDDSVFVLPEIDEATDEDLDKIVEKYDDEPSTTPDIMFTKPRRPQPAEEDGFKLNVENINSYSNEEDKEKFDNYLDNFDDEDDDDLNDDDGGSLSDKIKGFFKK